MNVTETLYYAKSTNQLVAYGDAKRQAKKWEKYGLVHDFGTVIQSTNTIDKPDHVAYVVVSYNKED